MSTIDSFAAPNAHPVAYSPSVLSPASEDVLMILLSASPSEAAETIEHSLDYGLLSELREAIAVRESLTPEIQSKLRRLYEALTSQVQRLRTRRQIASSSGFAARIAAEASQSEIEREHDEHWPPGFREVERRFAADDLLRKCAVFYDLETFPAGRDVGSDEVQLKGMVDARKRRGFCSEALGLEHVTGIARHLGAAMERGAVCFVREIRCAGHGMAPADELSSAFVFDGGYTDLADLRHPEIAGRFADVWRYMAPGASIIFEGCNVGRGEGGRQYLGAFAELVFSKRKWGFVRANRTSTQLPITDTWRGLPPGDPVTYRWPDDFA